MGQLKINYYSKDYDAIKAELIANIRANYKTWTDFSQNDFGMILLELFAGVADMTSFNIDNQVQETFLDSARRRENVARLSALLGHSMQPAKSGMCNVAVILQNPLTVNYTVPAGTVFKTTGSDPKFYTSKESFVINSSVGTPRTCMLDVELASGTQDIIDSALTGVDVFGNTDGGKLYVKMLLEGAKNKIALYKNSARTGTVSSDADDLDKVAYGEVAQNTLVIPMTEVNSSNIFGTITISANLATLDSGETLVVQGPMCHEGKVVSDTYISDGTANQRFNTVNAIQQIPSESEKTISLSVDGVTWTEVEDFFFERLNYYKVETINLNNSTIIFGDANSGRIPASNANVVVTYVNGRGSAGHVGAGMIISIDQPLTHLGNPLIAQYYNVYESTGSADAETIEDCKISAKESFHNRSRAVTGADYEELITNYVEDGMYNPTLAQTWKNEAEADLVNELEVYVLGTNTDTGKVRLVNIDLTTAGGLWTYMQDIKTLPEGIRKSDGTSGIMNGTINETAGELWFKVYRYASYDREVLRELIRSAVKTIYHDLSFNQSLSINTVASAILSIPGVQSVNIYSNSGLSTPAVDVDRSGSAYRGTVLALKDTFYIVSDTTYIKFSDEV